MYQAFLAIISLLGAAYGFGTKQPKIGLGFLVYTGAFILLIPNLAAGIKADLLNAAALVLFVIGSLAIVWKKKEKVEEKNENSGKTENNE